MTRCCNFKRSQVGTAVNSTAPGATLPASTTRGTSFDMRHMINHCGTAGLVGGTLGGDGGIELASSVVTMPDTQCQTHTLNKLTRDEAL